MNLTLFDLDGTLLPIDSDHAFGEFMVRTGWADGAAFKAENDRFFADYQAGRLDLAAYVRFSTAPWRDRPFDEIEAGRVRFFEEAIRPVLHEPAHALVDGHAEAGDLIAIVTATNEFVTQPIARAFEVPTLIAVELARDEEGRVTGDIHGIPSYREGKVPRVEAWLASQGRSRGDFDRITVYSDSTNDLPLLEWATEPVATNPSAALEAIARERGWRILRLFE